MSAEGRAPLVEARGVVKTYGGGLFRRQGSTRALDDVDLDIGVGEVVALIGESGSGKTTLGKVLLRLTSVDSGRVTFEGQDVFAAGAGALRQMRRRFQMVFQNQAANLHPKMTVREMMDESIRLHRPELDDAGRTALTSTLLERVGLSARADQRPASLSGGEKRRVGLARILATKPRLIVADEPTSGLDAAIKQQTITLLKHLKDADLAYLLISHDLGLVRKISERVVVMLKGRIIEDVPVERLGVSGTHHPYTLRLMQAAELLEDHAPSTEGEVTLAGAAAEHVEVTSAGCVYAGDCALARRLGILSKCASERPQFVDVGERHRVACFGLTEPGRESNV
jgi:ABC-type glutathione transport system ATPase component